MEPVVINNWNTFTQMTEHFDVGDVVNNSYAFRGHADSSWSLEPTLIRIFKENNITEEKAMELEATALTNFKSQAHLHLTPNEYSLTKDTVSWWTVMQHHGAPTRLLDWTSSMYAAAYFAVSSNFTTDGSIWIVHTRSIDDKMVELYGNTTFPSNENLIKQTFLELNAPKRLTFTARMSKSARMVAQQGYFSICRNVLGDHGEIISELFNDESQRERYRQLIIPAAQKRIFLKKLRSMNVTASSLFPGLDGLGKSVKELLDIAVTN